MMKQSDSLLRVCIIHAKNLTSQSYHSLDENQLAEVIELTKSLDFNIIESFTLNISQIHSRNFFGKGQVEKIYDIVHIEEIDLCIINTRLTPIQQRNLENELKCKVIDRVDLILRIFSQRAQTKEGILQVKIAQLTHEKSRLVRTWTHLERQRGGRGFLAGPGESQIEVDRRLISQRLVKLKKELENIKKTRRIQRHARKRVPYPIVALIGYTNAGKSTLFNHLTGADVHAEDLLFATLDPTMRICHLPSGRDIILSDTVGFISDLPHSLIDAFKATLEEVVQADVIIHVRDYASKATENQKDDVEKVLKELNLEFLGDQKYFEVLNKIDLLSSQEQQKLFYFCQRNDHTVLTSAKTGKGCENVLSKIDSLLSFENKIIEFHIKYENSHMENWLYQHAEVLHKEYKDHLIFFKISISPLNLSRLDGMSEFILMD